jgi:C4-dicarboxylate-specific signal transduction histidine kinase
LLGIFRDITEQKRLQAKLAQTQKLESLGLLAGGIAHDFNNILMGILGHASLAVRRTPEGHALQANLQGIMGAANQAADLCQQLLDYAGKSRAEPKTVNLNELVHQTKELIAPSASPNATLELALATDLPLVTGVVSQLRQILLNLILNGLESLEGAAGTVRVTTDSAAVASKLDIQWLNADELPLGASVSLVVEDTGCGMGPEVRDKIFDPFFSTKVEGRGLGLSAVLGIVRRHRGALRLESTPHRGTRFEILLPAAPGPSDPLSDE